MENKFKHFITMLEKYLSFSEQYNTSYAEGFIDALKTVLTLFKSTFIEEIENE